MLVLGRILLERNMAFCVTIGCGRIAVKCTPAIFFRAVDFQVCKQNLKFCRVINCWCVTHVQYFWSCW